MSLEIPSDLRIAVLLTYDAQLLDMAGIDIFGMLDKEYVQYLPGPLSKLGINVKIYYVGNDGLPQSEQKGDLRALTGQAYIQAKESVTSAAVQPGALDILLIPGPPPGQQQSVQTLDYVKKHAAHGTTILTVCTGCYVAAQAGILDGRKASGPRGLVPQLRKDFPAVTWDDQRRFVKDVVKIKGQSESEIWTSGGITNGLEMVAAYIREKIPGPLSETVCAMCDVGEKGETYDTTVGVDTSWWLGQILRALILGQRSPRITQTSSRVM